MRGKRPKMAQPVWLHWSMAQHRDPMQSTIMTKVEKATGAVVPKVRVGNYWIKFC